MDTKLQICFYLTPQLTKKISLFAKFLNQITVLTLAGLEKMQGVSATRFWYKMVMCLMLFEFELLNNRKSCFSKTQTKDFRI